MKIMQAMKDLCNEIRDSEGRKLVKPIWSHESLQEVEIKSRISEKGFLASCKLSADMLIK